MGKKTYENTAERGKKYASGIYKTADFHSVKTAAYVVTHRGVTSVFLPFAGKAYADSRNHFFH